ncbi:MAG: response regulator, partial [Bacteroidota bacterium]
MENIQLAIIEDDRVIRESLQAFLGANPAITLVSAVDSVEAFLATRESSGAAPVDIMLLDIGLPGMSGLEGIRPIRKA